MASLPIDQPPTVLWASDFHILKPLKFKITATKNWGLDAWDCHGRIMEYRREADFEITPGTITITPPGSAIDADFPKGRKSLYIAFSTSPRCKIAEPVIMHSPPGSRSGEIEEMLKNLIRFLVVKPYQANRIL